MRKHQEGHSTKYLVRTLQNVKIKEDNYRVKAFHRPAERSRCDNSVKHDILDGLLDRMKEIKDISGKPGKFSRRSIV